MTTTEQLQEHLRGYTGCMQPLFNPLYRWMNYTDGVKAFAEKAEAYWALDYIGFNLMKHANDNRMLTITIKVDGASKTGVITVVGDGETVVATKNLRYTTCPDGEWEFFLVNNMLMLPSEY